MFRGAHVGVVAVVTLSVGLAVACADVDNEGAVQEDEAALTSAERALVGNYVADAPGGLQSLILATNRFVAYVPSGSCSSASCPGVRVTGTFTAGKKTITFKLDPTSPESDGFVPGRYEYVVRGDDRLSLSRRGFAAVLTKKLAGYCNQAADCAVQDLARPSCGTFACESHSCAPGCIEPKSLWEANALFGALRRGAFECANDPGSVPRMLATLGTEGAPLPTGSVRVDLEPTVYDGPNNRKHIGIGKLVFDIADSAGGETRVALLHPGGAEVSSLQIQIWNAAGMRNYYPAAVNRDPAVRPQQGIPESDLLELRSIMPEVEALTRPMPNQPGKAQLRVTKLDNFDGLFGGPMKFHTADFGAVLPNTIPWRTFQVCTYQKYAAVIAPYTFPGGTGDPIWPSP